MESQYGTGQSGEDEANGPAISPGEIVSFVVASARRHKFLSVGVALGTITLGALVAAAAPIWYESQARILVEDSADKTTSLLGGHVRDLRNGPNPIRESGELIKQKSKVKSLVIESKLLENWEKIRPLPLRLKDRTLSLVSGPMTENAKLEVLADMVSDRISIWGENGIVTVSAQWRDPVVAQKLAVLMTDQLIETLQTQEFYSINSAIALLDSQAKRAAELIAPARDAVAQARRGGNGLGQASGQDKPKSDNGAAGASKNEPTPTATNSGKPAAIKVAAEREGDPSPTSDADAEAVRLENKRLLERLTAIREQIRSVETPWQRRLAELKLQLADMQATFGPEHPNVVQQQSRIETASVQPPELGELQTEERDLIVKMKAADQGVPGSGQRERLARLLRQSSSVRSDSPRSLAMLDGKEKVEDPAVIAAMAGLQSAIAKYTEVAGRADAARFELMIAQVAFQHQYVVVRAPEVPKAPKKPLRKLILLGSIGAAAAMAFLIGAIRDLLTGRVVAPWQIKVVGLQVIGELQIPDRTQQRTPTL